METAGRNTPITILECKINQIHEICRIMDEKEYSIRKISIGLKLFCDKKEDFEKILP